MQPQSLFEPSGSALLLLSASPFEVANYLMAWVPAHPDWDILRVRGTKSTSEEDFFDELAAALQFPYYFGENWNAVWDCITDLNWLKGSSFLIVFDSADQLMSESQRGFEYLLDVLKGAHERWHRETADFGVRGRQPITFQSVFACDPVAVDALSKRMSATGADFMLL